MKVKCYFEDGNNLAKIIPYDLPPAEAALKYCDQHADDDQRQHVVVVPLDEEASALPGWHVDMLGTTYKLFVVIPATTWTAREVATFHTRTTGSEPAPPLDTR